MRKLGAWLLDWWRECVVSAIIVAIIITGAWYLMENPYNQTFGKTIVSEPVRGKYVALTFDDGPNPPYTDEIVDYLHEQNVRATFFVVGMAVQKYPATVRHELADGDAIGNHSWDHAHLFLETRKHIASELQMTDDAIYKATGEHTRLFRPPFGGHDWPVIGVARDLGYQTIMWSVPLARDWEEPPPRVIADRCLKYVTSGSIIVLHDGNKGRGGDRQPTVEATKLIVQDLRARGFEFVTVPELIRLGAYTEHTPPPGSDDTRGEP